MRRTRCLLTLALAMTAAPAYAQFAVSVQVNGQSSSVANGGSITLNAPAVGQSVVAMVTITYLGNGTAMFPAAGMVQGSSAFTAAPGATSLTSLQSSTFNVTYNPATSAQTVAQFLWAYNQVVSGATTGVGAVSFNLIGTAPNVVAGTITSGNFVPVANGGTITFMDTPVNSTSAITVALSNIGSGSASISSIAATGADFQLTGLPIFPINLAANTQFTVSAQFTPDSVGPHTGMLQIGLPSGAYAATLQGNGVSSFLKYQITQNGVIAPLTPGQTITIPDTSVGGKTAVDIQFQNVAATAVSVNGIAISGTGYSISNGPFLPVTLQPQQAATITVTFSPTAPGPAPGRLVIGNDNFSLTSNGLGSLLQYSYQAGGATLILPTVGGGVSFPPLAVGQNESIPFTVTNIGTQAASIASIGLLSTTGTFQLMNLPALPLTLNPNASISFTITFFPANPGQASTSLLINTQSFAVTGFGTAPPVLPTFHYTGANGTQQPFAQPAIGLSLDSTYALPITGSLTLTISSNSFSSDPSVAFSNGSRTVGFTIPANSSQAVFPNGATQIQLQTGTVSGTFTIKPDFLVNGTDVTPANPLSLQLTVPSAAPVLLTASLTARTLTAFTLSITGYSTTRLLNNFTFQFTPAAGYTSTATSFPVDVSAASRVFFQTAAAQARGSEFIMVIPFTLGNGGTVSSGTDLTKAISSVTISGTNDIGTSSTVKVVIP